MNRTIRTLVFAASLAAPFGLSSLALAHGGRECGPDGKRPAMSQVISRHAAELGLAPDKVKAIEAAEAAARPELDALKDKVRAAHQAMRDGTGTKEQMEQARKAFMDRRQALRATIEAQLTDAQKEKLRTLIRDKHGRGPRRG